MGHPGLFLGPFTETTLSIITFSKKAEHCYAECEMYLPYDECHFVECCSGINFHSKKCL